MYLIPPAPSEKKSATHGRQGFFRGAGWGQPVQGAGRVVNIVVF
jgi:hypothetical protein